MNEYRLLADIMEDAAGYYVWKDRRLRLLRVILNCSFRWGLLAAPFPNHDVLREQTCLGKERLSEALKDLVRCRLVKREGHGKHGVHLAPQPDYFTWAAVPLNEQCSDPNYIAGHIGYIVRPNRQSWAALPCPLDPVTAYARAYCRGEFNTPMLFPDDKTLNQAIQEVAIEQVLERIKPHLRPPVEVPESLEIDELLHKAGELFPDWTHYRRDAYIKTVAKDKGFGTVFRALGLAQDFGPTRIRKPWVWLGKVVQDLVATANKPDS